MRCLHEAAWGRAIPHEIHHGDTPSSLLYGPYRSEEQWSEEGMRRLRALSRSTLHKRLADLVGYSYHAGARVGRDGRLWAGHSPASACGGPTPLLVPSAASTRVRLLAGRSACLCR